MRIHIRYVLGASLREYEKAYLPLVEQELRQYGEDAGLSLADDPDKAEIIVLPQSAQYKTPAYIKLLENDPVVQKHAERIYVIDYDDHPEGMIAGLYTSIEHPFYRPEAHRSWPILFMNNPAVYEIKAATLFRQKPKRLFSFVGATSHSVRKRLLELFPSPTPTYHVEEIKKWYNHNDEDRRRFLEVALDSAFCLCPRGYAAYTNRISEVMAMGRAPVVIADDWIPFSFREQSLRYFVRVAEKDVEHLPDILSAQRAEAEDLGRNARLLWETNCAKSRRVVAAVETIVGLNMNRSSRMSFSQYKELWHSRAFLRMVGWTPSQNLALKIEQRARRLFPTLKVPGVSPLMRYRNARVLP